MKFEFTVNGVSQDEALNLVRVFPRCVFRLNDETLKVSASLSDVVARDQKMIEILKLAREGTSVSYRNVAK